MLLCNNTAFYRDFRHQSRGPRQKTGRLSATRPIIAAMTDADELARRYLSLWTEYLTALLGDPRALEMLKRWLTVTGQFSYPAAGPSPTAGAPFPGWPPFFAPFAPPVPPASGDGRPTQADADALAALAERVEQLESRLAALEGKPKFRRSARGARRGAGKAASS
jgi:hypothetical protein